jgi:hypothetical protein
MLARVIIPTLHPSQLPLCGDHCANSSSPITHASRLCCARRLTTSPERDLLSRHGPASSALHRPAKTHASSRHCHSAAWLWWALTRRKFVCPPRCTCWLSCQPWPGSDLQVGSNTFRAPPFPLGTLPHTHLVGIRVERRLGIGDEHNAFILLPPCLHAVEHVHCYHQA